MFKQFFRGVQDKYKQMQEEEARYQELLGKVFLLPKFNPYTPVDRKKLTISYKPLMNMCPDLNEGDAVVVRGIIPIDEVPLACLYTTECKTALKFYFVATTKYLWLINKEGYLKYHYQNLTIDVIKNGMLSKTLLLGNMLFNVNGINEVLLDFVKLFQDANYREELIQKKLGIFVVLFLLFSISIILVLVLVLVKIMKSYFIRKSFTINIIFPTLKIMNYYWMIWW